MVSEDLTLRVRVLPVKVFKKIYVWHAEDEVDGQGPVDN
jgi:hypothetical protein